MQKSTPINLVGFVQRSIRPEPWAEGEKLPWNDPGYSRRMLLMHLSQEHDWADRRATPIQKHVDWIHREILSSQPAGILDLGCGPGLYTNQFAKLVHAGTGVDFGSGYNLVMFIYDEFNVFTSRDARQIFQDRVVSILDG
jgi:hypothetical protein